MASVELQRVSKAYPGQPPVLDGIDLRVEDGELLVLLGPNGSGKTTLLRMIAGLESVTSGEVLIGDAIVTRHRPHQRDVALVFSSGVLYPHLTVEQNLRKGGDRSGGGIERWWWRWTNRAAASQGLRQADFQHGLEERVRRTAQLLGIESLLQRFPRQLSGGERQRVALGRGFVRQPAVFLLDEPLANADMQLRQELRAALGRAREAVRGTMLFVSHDHTEALALGGRIAVLGHGRIQQSGPAEEVFACPVNRFVAEFIGTAKMSFVEGEWRAANGAVNFWCDYGRLPVAPEVHSQALPTASHARRVCMGWRPAAASVVLCSAVRRSEASLAGSSAAEREPTGWDGTVGWVEPGDEGATVHVQLTPVAECQSRDGVQEESSRQRSQGAATPSRTMVAARWVSPEVIRPGDRVRVEVDPRRTLWFDADTGMNLAGRR